MSLDDELNKDEQVEKAGQPDPLFKVLTRLEAEQLGMQAIETELQKQYTTRADLILAAPPGLNLEGTLFDFCRTVNVIEFKSENDPLTLRKYLRNELRTTIQFLQGKDNNLDNILNVIVSAREPVSFWEEARERGVIFQRQEGRPWLWRSRVGLQDVVIIVCRDLPLEEKYYNWLTFAPSDSRKWRDYVRKLLLEGNLTMLEAARQIRPREVIMVVKDMKDIIELARAEGFVPPKVDEEELGELNLEVATTALENLIEAKQSAKIKELFSRIKLERLLSDLKPEDRLAGLKPEDRLAGLTDEERQALLKTLLEQTRAQEEKKDNKEKSQDKE